MDTERILVFISIVAIVVAPWIGAYLQIVSNPLIRLLLLLFVLYSVKISELAGLLSLLAVVSIISERNYRTLTGFPMRRSIPLKKDILFENIQSIEMPTARGVDESEVSYTDNNPRLAPVPTGSHSAQFFMDNKLSV